MAVPSTEETVVARSHLDFLVVGIGASAGGIAAVRRLLEQMPKEPGMAFVVVLHLSPRHESSAAQVLQTSTAMPVRQVTEEVPIERNVVYVIPPTHGLAMTDGRLVLGEGGRPRGRPIVIDSFFRTLAEAHRSRAVGIVLSGTGADGAAGIGWLKQAGGVVIAQSPDDAEHDGMPVAAIATGHVDIVLPAADIAQRLVDLWANAQHIEIPSAHAADIDVKQSSAPEVDEEAFLAVLAIVRQRTGHDFRHYKRATLLRRIERRMQVNGLPTLPDYRDLLTSHVDETGGLLGDLLIGVTQFFRDRPAFEALEREIVPALFEESRDRDDLRVWVAGTSTGEEAFSISILLADEAKRVFAAKKLTIFATDLDERAIEVAREGRYGEAIVADVPPPRLRQYFTKERNGYHIARVQRDMVIFAAHDLLRDAPFSKLDLVSCRNLLIYLDREAQHDVLAMFHFALRPGGYLFLGTSETIDAASEFFDVVDKTHRIYRAKPVARAIRSLPQFAHAGPTPGVAPATSAAKPRAIRLAELHQRLINEVGSATVVVSTDNEIVHMSGRAAEYLRFTEGAPSVDIIAAIRPELRQALRVCLYEASQASTRVESAPIPLGAGEARTFVRIVARKSEDANNGAGVILLSFDELPSAASAAPTSTDGATSPATAQLEAELLKRTEQLQTTVEQYETAAEELKASNEELQAINEELRAATEELETSREELQSTNEELITVNAELKDKLDQLSVTNDDLTNLINVTEIATIFVDQQMRIKRFTPAAADIFSLLPTDVGRDLFDITHKLDYPALADDAQKVFTTLNGTECEARASDDRWFLARLLPYRTSDDAIRGVVLTFVDISSQLAARRLKQHGLEAMQLVADTMTDYAIATLDANGKITSFSAGAEAIFGWTSDEVVGGPFSVLFSAEDRAAGVPEAEQRLANANGRAEDERWHVQKNGGRIYLSGVLQPFTDGTTTGYVKIARDTTNSRVDDAARDLEMQAAQRDYARKSEFLAVMSHELKHPLNLINIHAEILTKLPEARDNERLMRAAQTIRRTVKSQARVIDDLLDLSRTEAGKLDLDLAPVLVADAIEPAVQSAMVEAREKGLAFTTDGLDRRLLVLADQTRVEQIAWNLLSNAIKFSRRGGTIALVLDERDGCAMLEVRDTGRGISPDFLPRVFEMLEQEASPTRRQEGGLGIGLALVKSLAEMQGGRVEAESPGAGRGAVFRVLLPLRTAGDLAQPAAPSASDGLGGMRILLVDDTADILDVFTELLTDDGAVVTPAASGPAALAAADAATFDVIISDIGMPHMDGYELIAELRARPKTASVPAIALTGFGRPQDVRRATTAGFDAHLDKPVDFDALRAMLERMKATKR